jgi:hypothetical protein
MLDPLDTVRYRALLSIQDLPVGLIDRDIYRLIILKCRDKSEKVSELAGMVISQLSATYASSILTSAELVITAKHLLRISTPFQGFNLGGAGTFFKHMSKSYRLLETSRQLKSIPTDH